MQDSWLMQKKKRQINMIVYLAQISWKFVRSSQFFHQVSVGNMNTWLLTFIFLAFCHHIVTARQAWNSSELTDLFRVAISMTQVIFIFFSRGYMVQTSALTIIKLSNVASVCQDILKRLIRCSVVRWSPSKYIKSMKYDDISKNEVYKFPRMHVFPQYWQVCFFSKTETRNISNYTRFQQVAYNG